MKTIADNEAWAVTQAECADLPGPKGIEIRRLRYAPFFLRMGHDVVIEEGCRFYHPGRIVIDDDVRINIGALVYGSGGLWIGRHARIGPRFFVHSANHNVEDGATAFFERGYDYQPTFIGDNVLISANVSVMPGATLSNGSFVAAGAVIPAGRYRQRARLFGVPATERQRAPADEWQEAPEIAFVVPESGHWRDGAAHLLSALGLPQVTICGPRERLPLSIHTAILYGPPDWQTDLPKAIESWRLAEQESRLPTGEASFNSPTGRRIDLPERVEMSVVADGREGENRSLRALEQALFWLTTRLAKGAAPVATDEESEWQAAFHVMGLRHGREDRLRERIEELIEGRRRANHKARTKAQAAPEMGKRAELVIAAANAETGREGLRAQVTRTVSRAKNAADLIACALAAQLLEDWTTAEKIRAQLASDDWRRAGVAMPRSTANGSGFCYSPLVLAWLFQEARRVDPEFVLPIDIGVPRRLTRLLEWRRAAAGGALVDEASRTISNSLIENWLTLHQAPCPNGSQVLLEDFTYGQKTEPLEIAWQELFLFLQGRKQRPLIRIRPWPAGKRAALSLRYDVDRPISSRIIDSIVQGQRALTGSACGSWYFFGGRAATEGQARQLAYYWQEIATHAEDPARDPVGGMGVTHHSAPTSMYWRGDRTNRLLDERAGSYGEFLTVQTGYPRPAWIVSDTGETKLGSIWTTPIHFPLEGSTSDTDLSYFDKRLDEFRSVIASGGHCIVGTHPDLNQELMERLLRREELEDVWFAPVNMAVERCRNLLAHGAVSCAESEGATALVSRETLADVAVEIRRFGSSDVQTCVLQLQGGHPRRIDEGIHGD